MQLTLVILAAGIGRRFGGSKQLERVGPGGASVMDYTIHDALRVGFTRVVLVIRPEMEAEVRAAVGRHWERRAEIRYAFQRLDDLPHGCRPPAERVKPWGTGQAVLAARAHVGGPFGVANADDYYGSAALGAIGGFLREAGAGPATGAVVGYALRETLSAAGAVSRAVCQAGPDGWLTEIREIVGLRPCGTDGEYVDAQGVRQVVAGQTPVSMNLWGFPAGFMSGLEAQFSLFLNEGGELAEREFHLPDAVNALLRSSTLRIRVLPAGSGWCGLTHPADREVVARQLEERVARGEYPARLW